MKRLFLFCVLLSFAFASYAQGLTSYTWKQHGVHFKVPGGAKILQSGNDVFEVDNDEFNVSIHLFDGSEATEDQMAELLLEAAEQQEMKDIQKAQIQEFSNSGVEGVSIEGNRSGDGICCALIMGKESHVMALVTIVYGHGLEEKANDIVNSITMTE